MPNVMFERCLLVRVKAKLWPVSLTRVELFSISEFTSRVEGGPTPISRAVPFVFAGVNFVWSPSSWRQIKRGLLKEAYPEPIHPSFPNAQRNPGNGGDSCGPIYTRQLELIAQ
jgi:hypothetical protein